MSRPRAEQAHELGGTAHTAGTCSRPPAEARLPAQPARARRRQPWTEPPEHPEQRPSPSALNPELTDPRLGSRWAPSAQSPTDLRPSSPAAAASSTHLDRTPPRHDHTPPRPDDTDHGPPTTQRPKPTPKRPARTRHHSHPRPPAAGGVGVLSRVGVELPASREASRGKPGLQRRILEPWPWQSSRPHQPDRTTPPPHDIHHQDAQQPHPSPPPGAQETPTSRLLPVEITAGATSSTPTRQVVDAQTPPVIVRLRTNYLGVGDCVTMGRAISKSRNALLTVALGIALSVGFASSAEAAAATNSSPSQVSALRFGSATYVFGKSASSSTITFRNVAAGNSWKTIPGSTAITSGPSAVINGSQVWVFANGSNGQLYYSRSSDLSSWSAWSSLGGSLTGAPAAVTGSPTRSNSIVVAGRNSSNGTYSFRYLQGSSWSSWYSAGSETYTTSPSLTLPFGVPGDTGAWDFTIGGVRSPGTTLYEVGFEVVTSDPLPQGPDRISAVSLRPTNARSNAQTNAQGRDDGVRYYRTYSNTLDIVDFSKPSSAVTVLSTPGVATSGTTNWICAKVTTGGAVSCTTQTVSGGEVSSFTTWVSVGGVVA